MLYAIWYNAIRFVELSLVEQEEDKQSQPIESSSKGIMMILLVFWIHQQHPNVIFNVDGNNVVILRSKIENLQQNETTRYEPWALLASVRHL